MSDYSQHVLRRRFLLAAGLGAAGAIAATPAVLLPTLRIVIPANPGGGWDQTGRALGAAALAAGVVGDVVYENMGGKGGTIGLTHYVQKYDKAADTVLMSGAVMVGAVALLKPAIDLKRVQPLARLTTDYSILVVRDDSPLKSSKDLVLRLRDKPDTPISGGSAGGVDHLFAGLIARAARTAAELNYLPFAGGVQVADAVMTGKAVAGISGYSELRPSLASGKLRAIGTSSKYPFMGIASVREQQVEADSANWRGVLTGRGVDAAQKDRLLSVLRAAVATKVWQKELHSANWDSSWLEGSDFQSFIELEQSMALAQIMLLKLKA